MDRLVFLYAGGRRIRVAVFPRASQCLSDVSAKYKMSWPFSKIVLYNDKIAILYNVQDGYFEYPSCFWNRLAGVEGIVPSAYGFGDRRSTS